MAEATERFHVYQAPAEGHTKRYEDVIAAENAAHPDRWIDPEAHEELGPGLSEIGGYDALLGDALEGYNAKQKRKDRRMTMEQYRESVRADTRGQTNKAIAAANRRAEAAGRPQDVRKEKGKATSVEVVFSLGNIKPLRDDKGRLVLDAQGKRQTPGRVPEAVTDAVYEKYAQTFQERNPNLFLCSAMKHTGEWAKVLRGGEDITALGGPPGQWVRGVSHVHLQVIPWADGYKQGMSRQVSTGKALAAMGFTGEFQGGKMIKSPWEQWQERERAYIAELAKEHGYEIVREGQRETSYSTQEYQEIQELRQDALDMVADAQAEAEQIKAQAQAVRGEAAKALQTAQEAARTFEAGAEGLKYISDMEAFMGRQKRKDGKTMLEVFQDEQRKAGKMPAQEAGAAAAAAAQALEAERRRQQQEAQATAEKVAENARRQQGGKTLERG